MDDPQNNNPPELRIALGVYAVHARLEEILAEINRTQDLTKNERHILIQLITPMRMGALAQVLQSVPSAVTALADALTQKGLIERRPDPTDRRASLLTLTDKGHAARTEMLTYARNAFSEHFGLSDTQTAALADLLDIAHDTVLEHGLPQELKV